MNVRLLLFVGLLLGMPACGRAQSMGQVECPRAGGYVYLYSSMETLDVRSTLQCKELVQIVSRNDGYFGVKTAKGDVGYVPQSSILLLKDAKGAKTASLSAPPVNREPLFYDDPATRAKPVVAVPIGPEFVLKNNTIVRVAVTKAISSATAKIGDPVELQVSEDVVVEGMIVIPKGSAAVGTITEVEQKRRMGKSGKLALKITEVTLANNVKAPVRAYHDTSGATAMGNSEIPKMGKDVGYAQGEELPAWTDGDIKLKRADFPVKE